MVDDFESSAQKLNARKNHYDKSKKIVVKGIGSPKEKSFQT